MALLSGDATNTISAETAEKINYDPSHQVKHRIVGVHSNKSIVWHPRSDAVCRLHGFISTSDYADDTEDEKRNGYEVLAIVRNKNKH